MHDLELLLFLYAVHEGHEESRRKHDSAKYYLVCSLSE